MIECVSRYTKLHTVSWWHCFFDWLVKSVHEDCMFSELSDKYTVLIKPYSTAIAKCFEDFFFFGGTLYCNWSHHKRNKLYRECSCLCVVQHTELPNLLLHWCIANRFKCLIWNMKIPQLKVQTRIIIALYPLSRTNLLVYASHKETWCPVSSKTSVKKHFHVRTLFIFTGRGLPPSYSISLVLHADVVAIPLIR